MKKAVLIAIGVGIGYFFFSGKNAGKVIRLGDKGKQIEGMQRSIERLAGIQFQEYGVYDNDTQVAVQYLMKGTNAMKNVRGDLNSKFVNDMSIMHDNTLNK
jgi:hypothetical protein